MGNNLLAPGLDDATNKDKLEFMKYFSKEYMGDDHLYNFLKSCHYHCILQDSPDSVDLYMWIYLTMKSFKSHGPNPADLSRLVEILSFFHTTNAENGLLLDWDFITLCDKELKQLLVLPSRLDIHYIADNSTLDAYLIFHRLPPKNRLQKMVNEIQKVQGINSELGALYLLKRFGGENIVALRIIAKCILDAN